MADEAPSDDLRSLLSKSFDDAQSSTALSDGVDALIAGLGVAARQLLETLTRRQLVTATWRLSLDGFSGLDGHRLLGYDC